MNTYSVYLVVPTFNEPEKVKCFLNSIEYVNFPNLEIVIINANPGDMTTTILKNYKSQSLFSIVEVLGESNEYWSASINRGLKYVMGKLSEIDFIIIANIDIEFKSDIVTKLYKRALAKFPCQISALGISNGFIISSGVKVKSWLLTLNKHILAGKPFVSIDNVDVIPVDYVPGRCFIFPAKYLKLVGLINEKDLPHYHADYEFSNRLSQGGCFAFIDADIHIYADMNNTGLSVYDNKLNFFKRVKSLISIKNPSNPYYRYKMVLVMYPVFYVPSALILYMLRTCIEVFFGSSVFSRLLKTKEMGFSGANNLQK
jgi:GT2 family glycosyltransferase